MCDWSWLKRRVTQYLTLAESDREDLHDLILQLLPSTSIYFSTAGESVTVLHG